MKRNTHALSQLTSHNTTEELCHCPDTKSKGNKVYRHYVSMNAIKNKKVPRENALWEGFLVWAFYLRVLNRLIFVSFVLVPAGKKAVSLPPSARYRSRLLSETECDVNSSETLQALEGHTAFHILAAAASGLNSATCRLLPPGRVCGH